MRGGIAAHPGIHHTETIMGEITIRKLDEATLAALDRRAALNGRTVEEELCSIVREAVKTPEGAEAPADRTELIEHLRRERDALAAKYGVFSDSTPLIREWRDK